MKKVLKIMVIVILITIFLFGNCYAIATTEKINIIRLATSTPNQTEFKVRFSGEPKVSNENKVKAAVTNDFSATVNVTDLTMDENIETVTYIVQNTSKDLSAELSVETTNSNQEYFSIESNIEKTTLTKGEATKVVIKIELIKEPVGKSEKAIIGIQLKGNPVQPTEDGNSGSGTSKPTSPSNSPTSTIPSSKMPGSSTPSTQSTKSTTTTSKYNYYEKDETPKTGNFKVIDIFWR